ncbi:MAG TPA: hypothetical protein VF572_02310 [Candidatus Saccharimonadales bacterium]|jgi:peptidoglycan/LPS O-acetylase OafA/YrhL
MKNTYLLRIAAITAGVLSIPLIAMLFSDEVDWNLFDFIVIGAMVSGAGLVYELGVKRIRTPRARLIAGIAVVVGLMLIWAHLAVGIIDNAPFAGS